MRLPEITGVLRDLFFPPSAENTYLQLRCAKPLSINSEIEVISSTWCFMTDIKTCDRDTKSNIPGQLQELDSITSEKTLAFNKAAGSCY